MNYGFVIDTGSCIGCHACSTACKSENQVPVGVNRTWVKVTERGHYPDVARHFQVTRCNHCENPPCVRSCPVTAMYKRPDGIVEFDADACIGCKACLQACPYDAIYIDPESHTAAKCHFCAHRIEVGQEPACVVVCPEHAILAGDLDDPASEISQVLARQPSTVRKPEQGTSPNVFYLGGSEVSLNPLASTSPGMHMFGDLKKRHDHPVLEPAPAAPATAAGHMVQTGYNAQHELPWHWPIPAYLVTKALAGGLWIVMAILSQGIGPAASGWMVMTGALAALLMAVTSGLLLYDLERPERFFFLFTRPQWGSWVARAAWILAGFTTLSTAWWLLELGAFVGFFSPGILPTWRLVLAVPTAILGLLTGTYTAFLFAQAEGRDLWQSPVTPLHMTLQTAYLGTLGAAGLGSVFGHPGRPGTLLGIAAAALVLSAVSIVVGELGVPRSTTTATQAQEAIRTGVWARHLWLGALLLGHALPLILLFPGVAFLALPALVAAALGMFAWELAWVMAPQQIPNS